MPADCEPAAPVSYTHLDVYKRQYVALADAVATGKAMKAIAGSATVLTGSVAAVSVGVVADVPVLDLDYPEDVDADTDMNVVMTGDGRYVEVQGTAEGEPFDRAALDLSLIHI